MSAYVKIDVKLTSEESIKEALKAMNLPFEEFATAEPLVDYRGQRRSATRANIIVRRKHLNRLSNDMGFEKLDDGTWRAHVSDYDMPPRSTIWPKFKQEYAVAVNTRAAKRKGYRVKRENQEDGKIKLTVTGYR